VKVPDHMDGKVLEIGEAPSIAPAAPALTPSEVA
jgi:hypothetical protein